MKEFIHSFFAIINKDTNKAENSSLDFSILHRYITVAFSFFALSSGLVFLLNHHLVPGLLCIGFLCSTLLLFILSYHINPTISGVALLFCVTIFCGLISYTSSAGYGIPFLVLFLIPYFFFSIKFSVVQKFLFSILIGVISLTLNILTFHNEAVACSSSRFETIMIDQLTLLTSVALIMIISYFFCLKFTQAEHQVYIYNRKLKKMASLDPLTNLMNRRGMSEAFKELEDEYEAGSANLSFAIGDIDFFKRVNDQYGHDCGDYILKSLSSIFSKYMEDKGDVCRWGGEEFLFAFNKDNSDNVFVYLNDLRHTIKHTKFQFEGTEISITMTFGLEEYNPHIGIEPTIKKADEKLYLGKESGRDKVVY